MTRCWHFCRGISSSEPVCIAWHPPVLIPIYHHMHWQNLQQNQHLFTVFTVLYSPANTSKEISNLVVLQVEYLLFLTRRIFVFQSPTVDTRVELETQTQALSLLSSHLQSHCLSTTVYTYSYMCVFRGESSGGDMENGLRSSESCFPELWRYSYFQMQHYIRPFFSYARLHDTLRALQRGCESPFVTLPISQQRWRNPPGLKPEQHAWPYHVALLKPKYCHFHYETSSGLIGYLKSNLIGLNSNENSIKGTGIRQKKKVSISWNKNSSIINYHP